MSRTKILYLNTENRLMNIGQFLFMLSLAVILPLYHNQMITGPLINALLFIAAVVTSRGNAVFLGLVPSTIALSVGLLPPVLAPMIPFIMLSNALMVLTFGFLKEKNYILSIIIASFVKFIFLSSTSSLVCTLLLKKEIAQAVSFMMGLPQLITALAGGIIALGLLKSFRKI